MCPRFVLPSPQSMSMVVLLVSGSGFPLWGRIPRLIPGAGWGWFAVGQGAEGDADLSARILQEAESGVTDPLHLHLDTALLSALSF